MNRSPLRLFIVFGIVIFALFSSRFQKFFRPSSPESRSKTTLKDPDYERHDGYQPPELTPLKRSQETSTRTRNQPSSKTKSAKNAPHHGYEVIDGAQLDESHPNNDGDSFALLIDGKKVEFRLYFVDAPEKRRHQYNGDRLQHQANYFGVEEDEVIEIGKRCADLTTKWLLQRPFRVYTKWDEVFDSNRYFAFIEISPDTPQAEFLDAKLVKAGLVRIYTEGADTPHGQSMRKYKETLIDYERRAKSAKAGAWKLSPPFK